MNFPRACGILIHPTSLPGEFGIGDLGPEAFAFVNFLERSGQTYWQILPLGPTGYGDSPYQSFSAFAGNTLLISPEKLVDDQLLTQAQIRDYPDFDHERVDYGGVFEWKTHLLKISYETFANQPHDALRSEFDRFKLENNWWLEDYALYRSLKQAHDHKAWHEWPADLKLRDRAALEISRAELKSEIEAEKFYQFLFYRQWRALKEYANKHGVKVIGDIPIFVSRDSADVWCNQDKFKLNPDGTPRVVSGVPPDFFSKTGQLWGNPIYDWDAMRMDGFQWWTARVAFTLHTVDIIRIDHFVGFSAAWEVPGSDETAENGTWVRVPGNELFAALRHNLGELPVIAEDLGVITDEVRELRDSNQFPGMKILQFAFGGDPNNNDLPHNYIRNCAAYTGTHDNDTVAGWWHSAGGPKGKKRGKRKLSGELEYCSRYLGTRGAEIHWDFIRSVWASVADTAITQAQDLLGIGSEGRMNLPASSSGNWAWRLPARSLTDDVSERLRSLTETYGRSPAS